MSKIMQNLIVLMEPIAGAHDNSLKAGNMILNRFCIEEDAAFELSGINKGMEYSFLRSYFIFEKFNFMNN